MKKWKKGRRHQLTIKKRCQLVDRKQAIKTACQLANPNDIILIAGKGHETYQEIEGKRHDFDDYKTVQGIIKTIAKIICCITYLNI